VERCGRGHRCRVVMWRQRGLCRSVLSCISDKLREAVRGARSRLFSHKLIRRAQHGCPLTLALALPFHSFLSCPPRSPYGFRER
jgi:hypothetical protein